MKRLLCTVVLLTAALLPKTARAEEPEGAVGTLFDLSGGLTRADLGDFPVALDGHAGWVGRHLGIEAFGSRSYTKTRPPGQIDKSIRQSYGLAGRVMLGRVEDQLRLEVRAEFAFADFKEGWQSLTNDSRDYENADITQATLLAGLRFRNDDHFARLSLGAGRLRDSYHHFAYDAGGKSLRDETDTRSGLRWVARIATRSIVVRGALSTRLTVDASTFDLRRVQFHRRGDAVPVSSDWTTEDSRETFVRARVFGDLPRLAFGGLVPGVFVGIDHLASGANPERGGTSPVFGIGLVQVGIVE